ncbi:38733_t:CDS:2, partial [Gigaspora margarita]
SNKVSKNGNLGAYIPGQSTIVDKFNSLVMRVFEKYVYLAFKGLKDYVKQLEVIKQLLSSKTRIYNQNISAETVSVALGTSEKHRK